MAAMSSELPHVVIIGGGFGGIYAARALRKAPVRITLLDRRNHHLFQPLLYQVATAALSAPDIAAPIRKVLRKHKNVTVLLTEAQRIDREGKRVIHSRGELTYDYLVVAAGATHTYFGNDSWAQHAPGLKSLEEAFEIRRKIFTAFEAAEATPDETEREAQLTFVVIGGGATGVELAGAISEIARKTLGQDFRNFDPAEARVLLLEGGSRVLAGFSEETSAKTLKSLQALGVEVRFGKLVTRIDEEGVMLGDEHIRSHTVLWAAGVRGEHVLETLGVELDRGKRARITPKLHLPDDERVFVIGDAAALEQDDALLPGIAPVAIQMGKATGKNILHHLEGEPMEDFHYFDKGSMATIGRKRAVAEVGRFKFSGFFAWLTWLFVHIMFLASFRSRVFVFFSWLWSYITFQRAARIIFRPPITRPKGEEGVDFSVDKTKPMR